jgi:hypothetical protein
MEGPFRAPKAIGALSIRSTRAGVENQMPGSRFPAPWSSEEHSGYFVVRDGNGQAMAVPPSVLVASPSSPCTNNAKL